MKTNATLPLRSAMTVTVLLNSLERDERRRTSSGVARRARGIFLLYILSMFFRSFLVSPEVLP